MLLASLRRLGPSAKIILRADTPARALEGLESYGGAEGGGRITIE